jgi:hypothetical protein
VVLFVDGHGSGWDYDVNGLFLKFDLFAAVCGSLFELALEEVLVIFKHFLLSVWVLVILELKMELVLGILVQDYILGGKIQSDNSFWFCFHKGKARASVLHLFGGRHPLHVFVALGLKS